MTLNQKLYSDFMTYLIYDKKLSDTKHNRKLYQSRYNIMAAWFEDKEFNRVNFTHFVAYLKEKGYSNNYINNFIKLAKHIDKFTGIDQIQDYTYFERPMGVVEYLTPRQIEDMINVDIDYRFDSDGKNNRYKTILQLMFLTGARINEILQLRWDDVHGGGNPYIILNQTKVNELRYAPIPQSLYHRIDTVSHFGGFIFSNEQGHVLNRESVATDITRRARAIGITRRVYPHLIRHSFVNFMLRNGAPLEMVSRLAGHKSIETTNQYYVHIMLDELALALHAHHPYFRKQQTLDFLLEKGKDILTRLVDAERYVVHSTRHKNKISLEVKEIE